jgi:hypothetical protein
VDALVKSQPSLARDIGSAIDHRQQLGSEALAGYGEVPQLESLVIA